MTLTPSNFKMYISKIGTLKWRRTDDIYYAIKKIYWLQVFRPAGNRVRHLHQSPEMHGKTDSYSKFG